MKTTTKMMVREGGRVLLVSEITVKFKGERGEWEYPRTALFNE